MAQAGRPEIDWVSAAVEGATLRVELEPPAPRGWRKRFEGVAKLLDAAGGRWGAVAYRANVITVSDVQEGAESDLRHYLESVVLQVNADLGLEQADGGGPPGGADRERDRTMAANFRAFAV